MTATAVPAPSYRAAPPANRTVRVEHCMGTVFSVDVRDPGEWHDAIERMVAWLHHVDRTFSTYKPASDISRMQRGELRLADAHPDVTTVLDVCAQVQQETEGAFTAVIDGRIDPTGLVKGWAVERASEMLFEAGVCNSAVNGGGDVQLRGEPEPGRAWAVGIVDPTDRTAIRTTVTGRDIAVATSGTSERGAHIRNPFTGRPVARTGSATVTGPSLTRADAYATAAFVMGDDATRWIDTIDGYMLIE